MTFDVYDHVVGSYPYRLAVGTWAQAHYLTWVGRVTRYLMRSQRARRAEVRPEARSGASTDDAAGRQRRRKLVTTFLSRAARTYLPTYTPHRIVFTPELQAIADQCSAEAVSVR